MPIYEYECTNKHRFEVIQRFDEAPVGECTVCGSPVQKLPSSPAIQFKGSGWYITDYGRKGQSSESSEKSTATSSDTAKEKSDSTPAAPAPAKETSSDKSSSDKP